MRPIRRKLKFDEESVNNLLQEIYNESHNIKAKVTRLFTKWELKIKETGEIQAIGDQIIKLIAAEAKNQDQKIMLLRYLKEVVFDSKASDGNNSNKKSEETGNVTGDRRNEILKLVEDELERKDKFKNN